MKSKPFVFAIITLAVITIWALNSSTRHLNQDLGRANKYIEQGDLKTATEILETSLIKNKRFKNNPSYQNLEMTLSLIYTQTGQEEKSINILRRLTDQQPPPIKAFALGTIIVGIIFLLWLVKLPVDYEYLKSISLCFNIIASVASILSAIPLLLVYVMSFDSPQSQNTLTFIIHTAMFSIPFLSVIAAWVFFALKKYKTSLSVFAAAFIFTGAIVLIYFK